MKKRFNKIIATVVLIVGIISLVITTSCGRDPAELEDEKLNELTAYKQYSKQIEKGESTALITISKNLGNIARKSGETYPAFSMESNLLIGSVTNPDDVFVKYDFTLCEAEAEKAEDIDLLILYKDDTEMLRITEADSISCINDDGGLVNTYFEFYDDLCYGWKDGNTFSSVWGPAAEDSFYRPTSMWLYNKKESTVEFAWGNPVCPIWADEFLQVDVNQ